MPNRKRRPKKPEGACFVLSQSFRKIMVVPEPGGIIGALLFPYAAAFVAHTYFHHDMNPVVFAGLRRRAYCLPCISRRQTSFVALTRPRRIWIRSGTMLVPPAISRGMSAALRRLVLLLHEFRSALLQLGRRDILDMGADVPAV